MSLKMQQWRWKMMNKKIFNRKQFSLIFKQLRTVGIIFTIIFALIMILIPVTGVASIKESIEVYGNDVTLPYVVRITNEMSILLLTFVIYTPLLTLMCWNFLTKRNASDFYHSLPYTRVCTYLTHSAAIIAWQLITLVIAGAVSAAAYGVLSDYFIVDYGSMLHMLLNVFGCNLLCMAGITLACTLTGNLFSNVVVSGMIIFLPRFMIMMVSNVMSGMLPVLSSEHMFSIMGKEYNTLVSCVFMVLGIENGSFSNLIMSDSGAVYTVVLALIYLFISGVLFYRRKSETAGNAASGRLSQAIIRIIIGFVISFFGIIGMITSYVRGTLDANDIIGLMLSVIFAAGAMIGFEAINIKSVTGALRTFPSIFAAIVLSVAAGGAMYGTVLFAEKYQPEVEDIRSFTMKESGHDMMYSEYENYFTDFVSQISISSDKVEKIFLDALKENVENIGISSGNSSVYSYMNRRVCYTVGFNEGIGTTYRNIYLTKDKAVEIMKELKDIPEYKDAMLDLPDADDVSVTMSTETVFTKEQTKDIYECMRAESSEIPFEKWYNATCSNEDMYSNSSPQIYITFTKNGNMYSAQIRIDEDLPKTFAKYAGYVNSNG
ncbi:MAG: hypothetical protein Q4F11_09405, partial [Eubacteriales bacterium]|nr:hypothetical protein [Eubacteriales bacterium]